MTARFFYFKTVSESYENHVQFRFMPLLMKTYLRMMESKKNKPSKINLGGLAKKWFIFFLIHNPVLVYQIDQCGHGSGTKFQFPFVDGIKCIVCGVMIIKITLRIRFQSGFNNF